MKVSVSRTSTSTLAYSIVIFLLVPLIAVVPISFTPNRYLSMPAGDWSLRHYVELLNNATWQAGIATSIWIGLLVALISTALSVLFSIGIWYTKSQFARLMVGLALLPMAVPPIISALTLFFFTTSTDLYDTTPGVVIAHTIVALPYSVVILLVSLSQVDRRIEQAARNLGASLWQTTLWVVLPNIRMGLLASCLISFVLSWEEISVTIFVTSIDVVTLPKLMWGGLRDNIDPIIAAISVLLICISVIAAVAKMSRS